MSKKSSRLLMETLDGLKETERKLVHEYGATIVINLINEGYSDLRLKSILESWRRRRQEDWLNTDYGRPR
jgi:hypothetical protein